MQIISHRGCLFGPDPAIENTPKAIEAALAEGFDVEIDLWFSWKHIYYLGHDKPEAQIDLIDLFNWTKRGTVYCHCKDLITLTEFASKFHRTDRLIPFYHDCDDAILLTNGLVWAHPNAIREMKDNCWIGATIAMTRGLPVYVDLKGFFGICTDYPVSLASQMLQKEYTYGNS